MILQVVQFAVETVADVPAVAGEGRRLVEQRRLDGRAHIRHVVQSRPPGCEPAAPASPGGSSAAAAPTPSETFRPTRSRGPADPSAARATSRSRSWTAFSASRNLPRSVVLNANSSTASRRSRTRSRESRGRSIHARSSRPRHRRDGAVDLVQQGPRPAALARLDHLEVTQRDGSTTRASAACRNATARTCARSTFCVSRR